MTFSTGGETSPSTTSAQLISSHKRKQIKKRKKKGIKHPSIGSNSSSHSSSATTHVSLASIKDADQFLKSPRFSPLPKYDRYFRDKLLQVNSEYPGQKSNSVNGNIFRNIRHLPESVKQEEFNEDYLSGEEDGDKKHRSKIDIFMDCDQFNHRGTESLLGGNQLTNRDVLRLRDGYSHERRHKSVEGRIQKNMKINKQHQTFSTPQTQTKRHSITDINRDMPLLRSKSSKWLNAAEFSVPEEKEEEDFNSPLVFSTERFLKNQKKLVSDDFELNYDGFKKGNRFLKPAYVANSYAQSIIQSDSEGDDQSSETSSLFSGTSSFRAKRNFLDVERLIDKLEPLQEMQSKFIDKIEDTIEEQKIQYQDESMSFLKKRPQIFNELKKHHKHQELLQKLSEHADQATSSQRMRLRSTSFSNEPIAEVEEGGATECDDSDPMHHHFRISRSISLFGQKRKKDRFHYDFRCDSPIMRPKKLDLTENSENSSEKQQSKSKKRGNSFLEYQSGSEMAIISDEESASNYFKSRQKKKEKETDQEVVEEEEEEEKKMFQIEFKNDDEVEELQNQSSSQEEISSSESIENQQQIIVEENQNEQNGSGNQEDDDDDAS